MKKIIILSLTISMFFAVAFANATTFTKEEAVICESVIFTLTELSYEVKNKNYYKHLTNAGYTSQEIVLTIGYFLNNIQQDNSRGIPKPIKDINETETINDLLKHVYAIEIAKMHLLKIEKVIADYHANNKPNDRLKEKLKIGKSKLAQVKSIYLENYYKHECTVYSMMCVRSIIF